jgi:hypothetical protein
MRLSGAAFCKPPTPCAVAVRFDAAVDVTDAPRVGMRGPHRQGLLEMNTR